jgi:hypothetical protein
VIAAPSQGADLPPAAPQQPAPEPVTESNPVADAERSAMRQRLRELENAEVIQRQASHPQMAQEEQANPIDALLANSGLPERAQDWLRAHPEFVTDARKNSALQHHHWTCADECEPYSDKYYNKMESLLGLRPPAKPTRTVEPAPSRQQLPAGVSAPVSREPASWSSGRPLSESTLRLTQQEMDLAATIGITPQQYLEGKRRMMREKSAGLHDDGRR